MHTYYKGDFIATKSKIFMPNYGPKAKRLKTVKKYYAIYYY